MIIYGVLRFTAEESHFPDGEMRLKCSAEIEGVWDTYVEGVALGGASNRDKGNRRDAGREPNNLLVRSSGESYEIFGVSLETNGIHYRNKT